MKCHRIMSSPSLVLKPKQKAAEAALLFAQYNLNEVPVVDETGSFMGMVSSSKLLAALAAEQDMDKPVGELLSENIIILSPDHDILDFLTNENQEVFPVVVKGRLVGVITRNDIIMGLEQLRTSAREEIEALGNAIYNPLISVDKNGNIRNFNKALENMVGLTSEQIQGRNITEIFANTKLLEVIKTGKTQSTQKLVVGDKTYISNRAPIIKDGQVVGAVAILQDISDLEAISHELESTKRLAHELDAIIESSFDGIYVTDGQGNTLRVSQGFSRITGVSAEECVGRNMAELVEAGVYSRSGTLLAIERRERVTVTLQVRTGKWVLVTSTPIFNEQGEIEMVVTNVRDITELNELERKLQQAEGLSRVYQYELEQIRLQNTRQFVFRSSRMKELINLVLRLAQVDTTVLIQGESGVGKELIADIIHANSSRKDGPFIKINCGAIPENLLESELFGYEPGAFTGASKSGKIGLFELANSGTIFLDEVAELPLELQVKLLRVLQSREIMRIGGTAPVPVDIRILAGTNRDLMEMVNRHKFREDLYYRLNVVPVYVPPLRERKEDIPALAKNFLEVFNLKYHMNKRLAPEVMESLIAYDWPGNVRELENLIERLVVTSTEDTISLRELPTFLNDFNPRLDNDIIPLREALENMERQLLKKAFAIHKSTYQVARALKVNQSTIVRKAAKYGIKPYSKP